MEKNFLVYQLFEQESWTYTYIIADTQSREAAIIDSVLETVDRDLKLIEELNLELKYILDTHIHADHITGAGELRSRTKAKTAVSEGSKVDCADLSLRDGEKLYLGKQEILALATPGHTDSCMSFVFAGHVFSGDCLMIRANGRTDFQQGSPSKQYDSIHNKLFSLPDETILYPGHDYRGFSSSTIGLEKKYNPRLNSSVSKEEFIKIMSELKLPNPKKIHIALPANMTCGNTNGANKTEKAQA